ncbi:MAG TPA: hypothetical protein VMQ60_03145 [Acidobacteriaceae bacterium]|jgi:hypothetical protein|nr:hypothetical protein [Acidobacteriaceae bacterium]
MIDPKQVHELKAAWARLKVSLDSEPATREVHATYESMDRALQLLNPELPVTEKAVGHE